MVGCASIPSIIPPSNVYILYHDRSTYLVVVVGLVHGCVEFGVVQEAVQPVEGRVLHQLFHFVFVSYIRP